MILASKRKEIPMIGQIKQKRMYAWFPKWVDGYLIWMHTYVKTYEYRKRERPVFGLVGRFLIPIAHAVQSKWDLIDEHLELK